MNNMLLLTLQKCDIIYGNNIISKEQILRNYWEFLAKVTENKTRVSFSFRTGSVCFDAIAIVSMMLNALSFNSVSNDDIVASLKVNDLVIYKGQRYRWKGIENRDGMDMMVLEQDGRGKNGKSTSWVPYNRYKQSIKPYYGVSTVTDGRGIRGKGTNREDIISALLNIPLSEVPSVMDVSFVVVSQKQRLFDLCKNVKIKIENNTIPLVDIIPAAYYTGNGTQVPIGRNPSKAEPVIRVTEQISIARDMILEKRSTTVGLLVMDNTYLVENSSELDDIINRSKPQYIHVSTIIRSDAERKVLSQYSDSPIFACTSRNISSINYSAKEENVLTTELNRQLDFIQNPRISSIIFDNALNEKEYRELQSNLRTIRSLKISDDLKDNFIAAAYSLLNLFSTAVFPLSWIDISLNNSQISNIIKTPIQRLNDLHELASNTVEYNSLFMSVIEKLEILNTFYKTQNPKFSWLREFLDEHSKEKILIIVPKAYYINILTSIFNLDNENIDCTTNRRFNSDCFYDSIITLCWNPSRTFDPLQCYSANHIYIPLYSYESAMYSYRKKIIDKIEKEINGEITVMTSTDTDRINGLENDEVDAEEKMLSEYLELERYIEDINSIQLQHFMRTTSNLGGSALAEVCYIGQFTSGEHIFFSKQYMAVVYSPENNAITEKGVKDLVPGDILVFTRRDDFTRNIVDIIFERLLSSGKLDPVIVAAKEKSEYWKQVLKEYKLINGLKHRDIARFLKELGVNIKASSVRQWLSEESHIIGPQQEKTIEAIAKFTQDDCLLSESHSIFEACRTIRSTRRKILKMISDAINDKLSGNVPPVGSDLEIVYQNVDKLAETMELEYLTQVDNEYMLQIGFINRPIYDEEVSQ